MRALIQRITPILGLLVILVLALQLWNVSRQVEQLWAYVLKPQTVEASAEVAALRAQLEIMRQYDQRLLQTVYWALAVIVLIAAALVGFGWYANFRVYERDKATMQQDLQNSLNAATAETRKMVATEVRGVAEEVANKSGWQDRERR